jgi:hypothetical protein
MEPTAYSVAPAFGSGSCPALAPARRKWGNRNYSCLLPSLTRQGLHASVSSVNIQLTKRANNENKHMTDRKTYMREYMRRRRASIAHKEGVNSANEVNVNNAYMQFTEQLCEVIRQEVEEAIQPLLVQLTKLTVNSVSNGILPAQEPTAAAQAPAKLPPERVPVLACQAKNLYAQGLSWAEIAKQWNAQSIQTLSGIGQWHGATVAKLVRDE